jgi:hypothetical protein
MAVSPFHVATIRNFCLPTDIECSPMRLRTSIGHESLLYRNTCIAEHKLYEQIYGHQLRINVESTKTLKGGLDSLSHTRLAGSPPPSHLHVNGRANSWRIHSTASTSMPLTAPLLQYPSDSICRREATLGIGQALVSIFRLRFDVGELCRRQRGKVAWRILADRGYFDVGCCSVG